MSKNGSLTLNSKTRDQLEIGDHLRQSDGFEVEVTDIINGSNPNRPSKQITLKIVKDGNGQKFSSVGRRIYAVPVSEWYGTEMIKKYKNESLKESKSKFSIGRDIVSFLNNYFEHNALHDYEESFMSAEEVDSSQVSGYSSHPLISYVKITYEYEYQGLNYLTEWDIDFYLDLLKKQFPNDSFSVFSAHKWDEDGRGRDVYDEIIIKVTGSGAMDMVSNALSGMVNNRRGPIKYDESLIKEDHSYKTREKYDYELSRKVERFLKDYGFDFEHGYPVDIIDRPDGKCEVEFEDGLQDRDYGILKRKAKRNPWNFEIVPGREHIHGGLLSVTFGWPVDESVKEAYDDAAYLRNRDKYTNKLDGQSDMFRDLGIRNVDIKYFVEPTCFEGTIEKIGPFNEIEDAVEFGRKYEQESPDAQDEDYAGIFITDSNGDIVLDCDETYDIYSNGKQFGESLKESTTDRDWEEVCKTYCMKKGYEFLFANDSDFGYYDPKSDRMVHKYADELAAELGYRGAYPVYKESLKERRTLKESRVNVIYFARTRAGYGNSIDSPEFDNVEDAIIYAVLNGYDEIVKCTYYGTLDTNPDYDSDKLEDAQRKYGIYVDYKRFKTEDELLAFLNDNEDYQGATDEYNFFDAYKLTRQKNESLKESADKEIDRKGFKSLIKYGVHDDGGNYAVLNDGNFVRKFWADNDDEAKVIFRRGPSRKPELTQDPMAAGQWYESFKGPKPSKSGLKKHNKQ